MITVNSYFCGAGLMDTGLMNAGIQIGQAFELDSDACKTYRKNIGNHVIQCDLAQQLVLTQNNCDGMVFTYPCTKYSTIADIHETRTGDELFLHALRHLALAKPEFYIVENVPGMRAFPIVMEAMTKLPDYYIQTFCPVQAQTWLPQKRDRLIIVGTRKKFNLRPPESKTRTKLKDILEADPQIKITKAIRNRMAGVYRDKPIISDPANGDIAPTCLAHYGKDKSTRLVKDKRSELGVRPYTVREYARLQGIEDWFQFPVSDTSAYKQIGNGVPRQIGEWLGREIQRYYATPKAA